MKKEFTIFIIGLLLGAIISTGSIFIYTTISNNNANNNQMQMPGGQDMSDGMPNGQNNSSASSNASSN